MPQVFDNRMVAHVWAQQRQDSGRSNNGQFYFSGPTLYSYGSRFVAGHIMPDGTALINGDGYSPTTGRHLGYARHAVHTLRRWYIVPGLTDLLRDLLPAMRDSDPAPTRALNRKRVAAHVAKRAGNLSPDAGGYILQQIGEKNPERAFRRIREQAERAAEKEKAEHAKRERANLQARGRTIAAMSPAELQEWIARSNRPHILRNTVAELRRIHKAIDARHKRQRAAVWAALKAVKFELDRAERVALISGRNLYMRQCVERLRLDAGNDSLTSTGYQRVLEAARYIATDGTPALGGLKRESFLALAARAEQLRNATAREEQRARYEAEQAARADWLSGVNRSARLSDDRGGALIRARNVERDASGAITGGTLETSHGASVPLPHAVKAFRFLKLCHDTGRAWQANGHTIHVGHFRIDSVEPSGDFKAGCHVIHWEEVERLARQLGVFDAPADDSALSPSHSAA